MKTVMSFPDFGYYQEDLMPSYLETYTSTITNTSIKETNAGVEALYRDCYLVINHANSFITNLEQNNPADLSDTRYKEMMGEARCMRAMFNLYLLRLFGEWYDMSSKYGIVLLDTLGSTMGENGNPDPRYVATYNNITNTNKTAKYPLFYQSSMDDNSYYFMRLPEVYYIKAEADEDMLGMILKNKIMELHMECGEEWFDLVRYHVNGGFESWSDAEKAQLLAFNQMILPIPRTAIAGNNNLIQNKDY